VPTALDNGQLAPKSWLARIVRKLVLALRLTRWGLLKLDPSPGVLETPATKALTGRR